MGLVIDLSHCGDQVTMDAIKYSKDPILITHSNPQTPVNHPRNKTDEQIKALAEKGGVIGMCGYSLFCQVRKGVRPTFGGVARIIIMSKNKEILIGYATHFIIAAQKGRENEWFL